MNASLELAVGNLLGDVLSSGTNALHSRGDNMLGSQGALVRVDADGPDVVLLAALDDTGTGAAGSVVDNVSALGDHINGSGLTDSGVTEGVGVVLQNFSLGVGRLDTGDVANGELVHGLREHTLNVTNGVGLGHHTGNQTYQVGSLVLSEHQASHVGQIDGAVIDDSELLIGVGLSSLLGSGSQHVAHADDQVVIVIDKGLDVALIVSVGLGLQIADLETAVGLLQGSQALPGSLVKGLVVDAAHVGNHTDLIGLSVFTAGSVVAAAGSQGQEHHSSQQQSQILSHVCVPPLSCWSAFWHSDKREFRAHMVSFLQWKSKTYRLFSVYFASIFVK